MLTILRSQQSTQWLAHPNNFGGRGCGKYMVDTVFSQTGVMIIACDNCCMTLHAVWC